MDVLYVHMWPSNLKDHVSKIILLSLKHGPLCWDKTVVLVFEPPDPPPPTPPTLTLTLLVLMSWTWSALGLSELLPARLQHTSTFQKHATSGSCGNKCTSCEGHHMRYRSWPHLSLQHFIICLLQLTILGSMLNFFFPRRNLLFLTTLLLQSKIKKERNYVKS